MYGCDRRAWLWPFQAKINSCADTQGCGADVKSSQKQFAFDFASQRVAKPKRLAIFQIFSGDYFCPHLTFCQFAGP